MLSRQLAISRDTPETQAILYFKARVHAARNSTKASALNESKSEQARAEQREACRGQCQQAAGDKIMIAHETSSSAAQGERQLLPSFDVQYIKHYSNSLHYSCCCYERTHFSSVIGGRFAVLRRRQRISRFANSGRERDQLFGVSRPNKRGC